MLMIESVFTIFASEDDGIDTLDFDDRAVVEFDSAGDRSVDFSEGVAIACYVICGAGVEVPTLDSLIIAARPEVGLCLRLVNLKRGCSRAMFAAPPWQQQEQHFAAPPWQQLEQHFAAPQRQQLERRFVAPPWLGQ
jgi:hypothetical protein